MDTTPIIIEETLKATPATVWNALTVNEQMKQWYFQLPEFKPEVGFEFQFEGGDDKQTYLHLCRITDVVPGKKLSHTWQYEGQPEETIVTWELFEEGDHAKVKLTHEDLDKIAHHGAAFQKQNFVEGWNAIISTSLKEFVEKQ